MRTSATRYRAAFAQRFVLWVLAAAELPSQTRESRGPWGSVSRGLLLCRPVDNHLQEGSGYDGFEGAALVLLLKKSRKLAV